MSLSFIACKFIQEKKKYGTSLLMTRESMEPGNQQFTIRNPTHCIQGFNPNSQFNHVLFEKKKKKIRTKIVTTATKARNSSNSCESNIGYATCEKHYILCSEFILCSIFRHQKLGFGNMFQEIIS